MPSRAFLITTTLAISCLAAAAIGYAYHRHTQTDAAIHVVEETAGNRQQSKATARLIVVGDLFFDRYIRQMIQSHGGRYVFSCLGPTLGSADLVVGNLEGPITASTSRSVNTPVGSLENYVFTFPTTTAMLLADNNIGAVDIGNNHIGNFGRAGIASTRSYLSAAGVGSFGGLAGDEPVLRMNVRGIPLSFVSYNQFGGESADRVALNILAEHAAGRNVIVYAHWGAEYSTSTEAIRPAALLFAQSGADAVIGSHPHVVGPHEYIGRTLVYYSLGNFIFDQYWNADVTHGLALTLRVAPGEIVIADAIPVELEKDGRTCPIDRPAMQSAQ